METTTPSGELPDESAVAWAEREPAFAIVPDWLIWAEVSDRAVRVYAALARYADKDGRCFPGRKGLAQRLGCSVDTLDRAVAELEAVGAVRRQGRFRKDRSQTSNIYRLYRTPVSDDDDDDSAPGSRDSAAIDRRVDAAPINENQEERESLTRVALSERKTRPRNELWDAIARACSLPLESSRLTKSAQGMLVRATAEIKAAGGTPAQVGQAAEAYRREFRGATLTPTALAKWWPRFASDEQDDDYRSAADRLQDIR